MIRQCFLQESFFVDCLVASSGSFCHYRARQITSATTLSVEETFRSRLASLHAYLLGPFLSEKELVVSLERVLQEEFEKTDSLLADVPLSRLLRLYLDLAVQKVGRKAFDKLPATRLSSRLVKFWIVLTEKDLSNGLLLEIVQQLEKLLCLTLSHGFSSVVLHDYSSDRLLRCCLKTKLCSLQQKHRSLHCLMAAMIESDPVRFAPAFSRLQASDADTDAYRRIFNLGMLDFALRVTFENHDFEGESKHTIHSLGRLLDSRSQDILSDSRASLVSLDGYLSALLACTKKSSSLNSFRWSSHVYLMTKLLSEGIKSNVGRFSLLMQQKIIVLSLRLCELNADGVDTLSSFLLVSLSNAVPSALGAFFKRTGSYGGNLSSVLLIGGLLELLARRTRVPRRIACLPALVRSSLRYGIATDGEADLSVRMQCIRLVGSLIPLLQDGATHSQSMSITSSFARRLPSQVFEMVTSHSKFRLLLQSSGSTEVEKEKVEVLRLMRCCLLAMNDLQFDSDVWQALLSCFDAGMSEKDCLVRELLSLLAEKAPSVSSSDDSLLSCDRFCYR